jgi:hypothetical protein
MDIKSYFEDIRERIIEELVKAETSIYIAVAWFTDKKIFDVLCQRATLGIKVEIIAIKDEINTSSSIDFNELFEKGGKIFLVEDQKTMHNKFCIIDNDVVINGSYNWTNNANNNRENIMIITNHYETVENYLDQFKQIKKINFGTEKEAYKKLSIRLSILKGLIDLNDTEDIDMQIRKIKESSFFLSLGQFNELKTIIYRVSSKQKDEAILLIDKLIYDSDNYITEEEIAENSYNTIFDAVNDCSIVGVKLFINKGESVNIVDSQNNSLFHYSAKNNDLELIKYLIGNNANINVINSLNEYPIDLLDEKRQLYIECFDLMFNNNAFIDSNKKTLSRYCYRLYASKGFYALKAFLNKFENVEEYTSKCFFLDEFIDFDDIKVKDFLISKGVNINQLDSNNEHLFDNLAKYCCNSTNYDFIVENMNYLKNKGIDWINYYHSDVFLHIIVAEFNYVIPIEVLNYKGETPFEYLMKNYDYDNINYKTIKRFIHSADKLKYQLFTIDSYGDEKLRFNCSYELIIAILNRLEEKRLSKTNSDYNDYYEILKKIFMLNVNVFKNKMLVEVLKRKLTDLAKILVLNGADVNIKMKINPDDVFFSKSLINSICGKNNCLNNNLILGVGSIRIKKTITYKNIDIYDVKDIIYNNNAYLPFISCLEYVKRCGMKELYNLFMLKGAIQCEEDIKNIEIEKENKKNFNIAREKIEKEIELAKLKIDTHERETQLEVERNIIEQQAIEAKQKKDKLEYENSSFLKKIILTAQEKKKKKSTED